MKKFISLVVGLSLVASTAMADPYYNRGYERHEHRSSNKWVAPLLGGVILGAIINESRNRDTVQVPAPAPVPVPPPNDYRYYNNYPPPNMICETYYIRDSYGTIVTDVYGNYVVGRRCWYR